MGEEVGMEKVDTYYGTWNGIGDWDTYTGDKK
jgi:hypothetical protein